MSAFQITPQAKFGSLFKSIKPNKKTSARVKLPDHLAFLRKLNCLASGVSGPNQAAHIRYTDRRYFKTNPGMQQKSHDWFAVPLSEEQHRQQHAVGDEKSYWQDIGIDPVRTAILLYIYSGDEMMGNLIISEQQELAKEKL